MTAPTWSVLTGDAREMLKTLPAESCHTCVTSPPYFGLRSYDGGAAEIGREETPQAYVDALVAVFREVRRVLRKDGTVWLNLGDSYAAQTKGSGGVGKGTLNCGQKHNTISTQRQMLDGIRRFDLQGLKPKDLIGIPWLTAFALRADGWYLRSDCIWNKPNPMPESVEDRPTKSHEYVFLLTRSERYFYDAAAIAEPAAESMQARAHLGKRPIGPKQRAAIVANIHGENDTLRVYDRAARNKRSVWTVSTPLMRLRSDLTPEQRAHVLTELARRGGS